MGLFRLGFTYHTKFLSLTLNARVYKSNKRYTRASCKYSLIFFSSYMLYIEYYE